MNPSCHSNMTHKDLTQKTHAELIALVWQHREKLTDTERSIIMQYENKRILTTASRLALIHFLTRQ